MSDESRDEEDDPIVISPLLSGEAWERVQRDYHDAIREAEMNRTASPLRIVVAAEDAPKEDRIIGIAGEDLEGGDIVTVNIGTPRLEQRRELAFNHARTFEQTHGYSGSIAMPYLGSMYGSMAYMPGDFAQIRRGRQYQFTERFPQEVRDKAWKLLEQFMTPEQHFAFTEKADIELENVAGDFRLIINRSGKFTILEGARGKGIVAQSGNVRSYKYPLGDEIAAFIDWFNHRTKELIAQWGCGTYGIVKEGEGR